jgi:hypothetical protein
VTEADQPMAGAHVGDGPDGGRGDGVGCIGTQAVRDHQRSGVIGAFLAAYCALAFYGRKSDDLTYINIPNPDIRITFFTTVVPILQFNIDWNYFQIISTDADALKV